MSLFSFFMDAAVAMGPSYYLFPVKYPGFGVAIN
jgi:hypothetical protein